MVAYDSLIHTVLSIYWLQMGFAAVCRRYSYHYVFIKHIQKISLILYTYLSALPKDNKIPFQSDVPYSSGIEQGK